MPKKTAVKTTKSKSKPATAKKEVAKNPVKEKYSKTYTNMFQAYKAFWKRGFTEWAGTSSRSEYWWTQLVNFILLLMFYFFFLFVWHLNYYNLLFFIVLILFLLYVFATVIPVLSLSVRRLHDAGQSAWWLLLILASFIPMPVLGIVASIVLFVLMLLPTKEENNPYHKNNK